MMYGLLILPSIGSFVIEPKVRKNFEASTVLSFALLIGHNKDECYLS